MKFREERNIRLQFSCGNEQINTQCMGERGPFSNWTHSHIFKEKNGGTIIIDQIDYSIPFGLIGGIANYIFVEKDLGYIFDYREKAIMDIFNNHSD